MKCKPYSDITVEIRTQLKTVKITSNIFAVKAIFWQETFCASVQGSVWMKNVSLPIFLIVRELPNPGERMQNKIKGKKG